MSLGSLARRVLGDRLFLWASRLYRGFFVDLDAVAACMPRWAPGTALLDVGGGDGELLNRMLARNAETRAMIVDLAPSIGVALRPELRDRVRLFPATSLAAYRALGAPRPDAVLICDVLHHVPAAEREGFLAEVRAAMGGRRVPVVVKEVEPRGIRAGLGWLADRFVSGDRNVRFLAPAELRALVARVFPEWVARDTPLLERDAPNYCIVFEPLRNGEPL